MLRDDHGAFGEVDESAGLRHCGWQPGRRDRTRGNESAPGGCRTARADRRVQARQANGHATPHRIASAHLATDQHHMAKRTLRVAMEGATGRLGTNQHLIRSVLAIRNEGGLPLKSGDWLIHEPVLVGRNVDKLSALAAAHGGLEWSMDRAATLADKTIEVYFDSAATGGRLDRALQAIAAGKHIYLEKPVAGSFAEAMTIVRAAHAAGVKAAAVQDKIY